MTIPHLGRYLMRRVEDTFKDVSQLQTLQWKLRGCFQVKLFPQFFQFCPIFWGLHAGNGASTWMGSPAADHNFPSTHSSTSLALKQNGDHRQHGECSPPLLFFPLSSLLVQYCTISRAHSLLLPVFSIILSISLFLWSISPFYKELISFHATGYCCFHSPGVQPSFHSNCKKFCSTWFQKSP